MRLCAVLLSIYIAVISWSQGVEPAAIAAHQLTAAPAIDGVVDATEWAEALEITTFYNPVRGGRAERPPNAKQARGQTRCACGMVRRSR
ncbi:MAG: hypothetical protein KatS3mg019_1030 [Fimbriimonadales bacterium]|nr:MAG: hypothetical protein KatS3mg019_1030 [Fimbriimonadales bacterium]